MKPRAKKKKLKKRFPFSDEWKPRRIGYMERLHKCPVCGGSRRSGYYRICPKCAWVYEWQNENRKVPCLGCKEDVNRSDAKFCLLDNGLYCYFCKDCLRKMQKENPQQKKEKTTKEETDLTEISKFEWKEKTCEDIIEDMRKIRF